eukprot:435854_1
MIRDDHEYIATIDNKRLQKIAQIDPNKSYKRIQVQNLTKLKTTIRGTINNMMERKRKKLLDNKKHSSDKQEADDTEHEAIPNEHKLEIIEKALNACYTQLMYYNKLFLNPVGVPNTAQIEAKQVNDERRKRINQMKQKIEDKRNVLIQRTDSNYKFIPERNRRDDCECTNGYQAENDAKRMRIVWIKNRWKWIRKQRHKRSNFMLKIQAKIQCIV